MAADDLLTSAILIVDDEPQNVDLLERILRHEGYVDVRSTTDPGKVEEMVAEDAPDILLLDLLMPPPDGYAVMEMMQDRVGPSEFLPILVLTADSTPEAMQRALAGGATDFVTKPFDRVEVTLRIRNLLRTRKLYVEQQQTNTILDAKVHERTAELAQTRDRALERLAVAAEIRDDDTGLHTHRVGITAWLVAQALGLPADRIDLIGRTAGLHDVGKIGIPDRILLKPGKLSAEEFEEIKQHPQIGVLILGEDPNPLFASARIISMTHHERPDGKGYPRGLKGDEIPIEGRIVAVADVYDALIHERPYKEAWPVERALEELQRCSGTQFDPEVLEGFMIVHEAQGESLT